ncbi:hypothetical protein ABC977_00280 [Thioalkalicoccus limnaeus]|uniref:Uncharacterized protein n=1 Tax=Thioalkalicoccus limnaeus TaxID=120681 RepID=A0ABV4B943_9GAMM
MPPTFDDLSLTKLSERTDYECWLLEAVYAIVEHELFRSWPDGVIYTLGNPSPQFIGYLAISAPIGDWRPGFLKAGAPLVLVSTFKLIDMLVEWVLRENGVASTFKFQQKLQHLENTPEFPPLIETRPWLKKRIVGLYSTLEPLRGTIIHDRHFATTDGSIRVSSSKGGVVGDPVEITGEKLRILARVVVSVLKYLEGDWQLDEFREKRLRRDLDELQDLHRLPTLGQRQPFHVGVRVYTSNPDPLQIDIAVIRQAISSRHSNSDISFDLRVLVVQERSISNAFFFPWVVFANANGQWDPSTNPGLFRAGIPNDIKPEHLHAPGLTIA